MGIYWVFLLHILYLPVKSRFVNPPLKKNSSPSLPHLLGIYKETWNIIIKFVCIYLVLNISIFIFFFFLFFHRDLNKVYDGIGTKIGMFLQAITIVLVGFIMGFVYGWKLTLVIIAISPLLMIAGGIMAKVCSFQCSDVCYPYMYQLKALRYQSWEYRRAISCSNVTVQMHMNKGEKFSYWHLWFDDQKC